MAILTIPHGLAKKGDLVLVPRKDYEELLRVAKRKEGNDWLYREPFVSELKKRIRLARVEFKTGKLVGWRKS
ncbi:hypothetical protein HY250_04270 [Candidatus Azambacteria bacterium]|nr:hypothetical protein [Candidatus Azambacteria bacterium]MBI3685593.1 hypothetical protein [Candidatus Azambacteria bacterium]